MGLFTQGNTIQEDLEDFSRFPDQGAVESGRSLEAIQLETWEGTGTFIFTFTLLETQREMECFLLGKRKTLLRDHNRT